MATDQTFEQLIAFLHEDNWRFRADPESERIEVTHRGRNGAYRIIIGLDRENSTLLVMAGDLDMVGRPHQHGVERPRRLHVVGVAPEALHEWAERLRNVGGWKRVYVYVKHDEAGRAPALAQALLASLGETPTRG